MTPRFMADENIPFRIVTGLRTAGYDVLSVKDVAHVGMRNNELAELSIRLDRIIITRDADFTRLTKPLLNRMKVIYVKLTGDPGEMARFVLDHVEDCLSILQRHNVVILDNVGSHAL